MFESDLESLRQLLMANVPLFDGNGVIIERGKEQRIKGITDDIRDYFYIDYKEGGEQIVMEKPAIDAGPVGAYFALGSFKLVARVEGLTATSALNSIFACLANNKNIDIETITQDSQFIYDQEYEGEHEITCDLSLYMFEFVMSKLVYNTKICVDIVCKDNAC